MFLLRKQPPPSKRNSARLLKTGSKISKKGRLTNSRLPEFQIKEKDQKTKEKLESRQSKPGRTSEPKEKQTPNLERIKQIRAPNLERRAFPKPMDSKQTRRSLGNFKLTV